MNYYESYGVFYMAMSLPNRNNIEIDFLWEDAIYMYNLFISSDFNDCNKSEIDCIYDFLKDYEISKKKQLSRLTEEA